MCDKEKWIKEVAQEIDRSEASLKKAIKAIGIKINSKSDVLLCYAKWSVPKLKAAEKQEQTDKKRIKDLEQLVHDLQKVTEKMKTEFDKQMKRKEQVIETQNEIIAKTIAEKDRIMVKLNNLLKSLPLASGE